MAELFLFSIAEEVLRKLGSLAVQEMGAACGVTRELNKLKDTFTTINAVILDAEEQQWKNHALSVWLDRLKVVCHRVDDVLDEFEIVALQRRVMKGNTKKKVFNFFSYSNPLIFRFRMGHRIKLMRKEIDASADDRAKFHLVERGPDRRDNMSWDRETYSYLATSSVIGREKDRNLVVNLLMRSNDNETVSVVPIVGIGGLGKTTLAKMVYHDERVVGHFELRIWVCVSLEFNIRKLIGNIVGVAHNNNSTMEDLQACLQQKLRLKRFLLVLDDVWNEDPSKWMEFRDLLMGGAHGSKIVVTTRSQSVASVMSTTTSTYYLTGLPNEDCLVLFKKFAFAEGQERESLMEIGKVIVSKCSGVPLAIRTVGGLLRMKTDEREWILVRDSGIWNFEQGETDILPALKLSYDQLPWYLKRCFAFCSVFPKDYEFNHMELIYLWMAEGLIMLSDQNLELEDIGKRYFNELLSRSFFHDVVKDFFVYKFKMHDLMHDLAVSMTRNECSVINSDSQNISEKVCHISFFSDASLREEAPNSTLKLKNLRTIFRMHCGSRSFVKSCVSRFKCLRVLDLRHSRFDALPSSIGSLRHLRFLSVSYNRRIKSLPISLCELHGLQTLGLENCVELHKLPRDFGNMISLRCVTLTTQEGCFQEKQCRCLTSLRLLAILDCINLKHVFDRDGIEMRCFTALQSLVIGDCKNLSSLPLCFRFLTQLENLVIGNCEELDLTVVSDWDKNEAASNIQDGGLRSLQNLCIGNLPKLEALPGWLFHGSCKTLKHIVVRDCINFTGLPDNLRGLQKLEIIGCPCMMSLPEGMNRLNEIQIHQCPQLVNRCNRQTGEDWHKIAHVSHIYVDCVKI